MAKKSKSSKTTKPYTSSGFTTTQNFNPDYTYVINDLKRIGLLAGFFLIVLVGISLIIQ